MKKYLIALAGLASVAALLVAIRPAQALTFSPSDLNNRYLNDGDLISASQDTGGADPDIFIIKLKPYSGYANPGADYGAYYGFKRLFLNPAIFKMYGHLGGFSHVHQVTANVRDSFVTSGIYRNCETGDQKVWATEVTGEDDGILHHVQVTGEQAVAEDPYFFDRVFCINSQEERFYAKSIHAYTRLIDIPRYFRIGPTPPACLSEGGIPMNYPDSDVRCCTGLTPRPATDHDGNEYSDAYMCTRPGCHYEQIQCVTTPCNPILVCPTATPSPTCYPLPACAQPGANPVCDLATYGPDGRPWCPIGVLGNYATITSASLRHTSDTSYVIDITGTLPTPCDTLTEEVSHGSNRYDIELRYRSTLGPNDGACVQVIQPFSRSVVISTAEISAGTHYIYVNNDSRFLLSLTK